MRALAFGPLLFVLLANCGENQTDPNFGVIFTCGTTTCDSGSQYCETTATDVHCTTLPTACGTSPACSCISQKCCTFAPDGSMQVDDTGKSCD